MYQTLRSLFHEDFYHQEGSLRNDAPSGVFLEIQDVGYLDETVSRVFDI